MGRNDASFREYDVLTDEKEEASVQAWIPKLCPWLFLDCFTVGRSELINTSGYDSGWYILVSMSSMSSRTVTFDSLLLCWG